MTKPQQGHHGRQHFVDWYRRRGRVWLGKPLDRWTDRPGAWPTELEVLDLGSRLGSCSPRGRLNIRWPTMQLAVPLVDYQEVGCRSGDSVLWLTGRWLAVCFQGVDDLESFMVRRDDALYTIPRSC